nr:hypothetical protein B0A51_16452 [Rachicladosporium sp. CCFEE 5018]
MSRHTPAIDSTLTDLRLQLQGLHADCSALVSKPKKKAQTVIEPAACEKIRDGTDKALATLREIRLKLRVELGHSGEATKSNGPVSESMTDAEQKRAGEPPAKKRRTGAALEPYSDAAPVAGSQADIATGQTAEKVKKVVTFTEKQVFARLSSAAAEFQAHAKVFPQYLHRDFDAKALLDILGIVERAMKELADGLAEVVEESRIDREEMIRTAAMNPNFVVPTIEGTKSITTGVPTDLANHGGGQCELTTADARGNGLGQMADAMQVQADELQNIIKHWPKSE